jgi:hypothetical protein
MLKALKGLKNAKYKNVYVLTVKGYFGDGDEYFTDVITSQKSERTVERAYEAYKLLDNNPVETRDELPEQYQECIKGASWDWDILPSGIDEITLYYYDELGNPNDVEVI